MIGTAARTSSWLVTDNSTPRECCALTMNFHSDQSPAKGNDSISENSSEGSGGSGGAAPLGSDSYASLAPLDVGLLAVSGQGFDRGLGLPTIVARLPVSLHSLLPDIDEQRG